VVLLGTHLANEFSSHDPSATTSTTLTSTRPLPPLGNALERWLAAVGAELGRSTAVIDITTAGGTALAGVGYIVRSDCMIMTSARLVDGAAVITAVLATGAHVRAKVVGTDAATDIAMIHCPAHGLRTIPFDLRGALVPGQTELVESWSAGGAAVPEVSEVGSVAWITPPGSRRAVVDSIELETWGPAVDGALISSAGIAGIVEAGRRGQNGTATATPAWLARDSASDLIASGRAEHDLGIRGHGLSPDEMRGSTSGCSRWDCAVKVTSVQSASPAWRAGIRPGDVIESVDGVRVTTMSALLASLYHVAVGARTTLRLLRDGRPDYVEAVLGVPPPPS
jgi:S1-C subfamily serine protease